MAVREATAGRGGPILLGGGAAASPLLWQDLADATGRDVVVEPQVRDHSAFGAALFAADALGNPITRSADRQQISPRARLLDEWSRIAERHDTLRRNVTGDEARCD